MKLYATVTSERASKGQGGKYLDISIMDSNKEEIGKISVRQFKDDVGDGIKIFYSFAEWAYPSETGLVAKSKGNKQKGDFEETGSIGGVCNFNVCKNKDARRILNYPQLSCEYLLFNIQCTYL